MKKFNWGHGITIFYILFVGTLLMVLIASFGVDHSLVVEDYYAKDLDYQNQYNKVVNSLHDNVLSISYDQNDGQVILEFSNTQEINGIVQFYRPSNQSLDFEVGFDQDKVVVPTSHLPVGKWKIKVDWTSEGKAYYKENEFYF